MLTLNRQMYLSVATSTVNDAAHLDITANCMLVGVLWAVTFYGLATGDFSLLELSTSSAGQFATNDAQNVLSAHSIGYLLTTSGGVQSGTNTMHSGIRIPLPSGTRVYLHSYSVKTSGVIFARALLNLEYK